LFLSDEQGGGGGWEKGRREGEAQTVRRPFSWESKALKMSRRFVRVEFWRPYFCIRREMIFHISASWVTPSFKSSVAEMMIPTKRDWRIITESEMKTKKYQAASHPAEGEGGERRQQQQEEGEGRKGT
jgi:hypothetical protein